MNSYTDARVFVRCDYNGAVEAVLIKSDRRALNRASHERRMGIEEVVERKSVCIRQGGVTERDRVINPLRGARISVRRINLGIAIVVGDRRGHAGRH